MPRKAKTTGLQLEPVKPTRRKKPQGRARELDVELLGDFEGLIKSVKKEFGTLKVAVYPDDPTHIYLILPDTIAFCTKCQHLMPVRLMAGASLCKGCRP